MVSRLKRKYDLYLEDILQAVSNIEEYVGTMEFSDFEENKLVADAVLRNLEIIGESATQLPHEIVEEYKQIPWRDIKSFRVVVAHKYWSINKERIWDIIKHKLEPLKIEVEKILKKIEKET